MLMKMLRSLMPKEERFIEYFAEHTERMVAASDALAAWMAVEPQDRAARFKEVSKIESEADEVTKKTIFALHRAFITPFDRSDIHALITALDNAVDLMEEVTEHATLYGIDEFNPHMREFAVLIGKAARRLAEVMPLLAQITRNSARITTLCDEVGQIETDADKLLRLALSDLIAERPEAVVFLGRKEVYDLLEAVTDRCAEVADLIEGIVLDHV